MFNHRNNYFTEYLPSDPEVKILKLKWRSRWQQGNNHVGKSVTSPSEMLKKNTSIEFQLKEARWRNNAIFFVKKSKILFRGDALILRLNQCCGERYRWRVTCSPTLRASRWWPRSTVWAGWGVVETCKMQKNNPVKSKSCVNNVLCVSCQIL